VLTEIDEIELRLFRIAFATLDGLLQGILCPQDKRFVVGEVTGGLTCLKDVVFCGVMRGLFGL
jgi:hypothetical protein